MKWFSILFSLLVFAAQLGNAESGKYSVWSVAWMDGAGKEVQADGPRPFREAVADASTNGRTLYVWVDYWCPSSAGQIPNADHYQVRSKEWLEYYENRDGAWIQVPIRGPAVVVLKPHPVQKGLVYLEKVVPAKECCAASLTSGATPLAGASRSMGGG